MNLFFQLLPLLLLSVIIGMAAVLYLVHASKIRQSRRHSTQPQLAAPPPEQRPPASGSTAVSQITSPRQRSTLNAPILRLHDLEMTPAQIAAALEKPLQEIEITLKFEDAKRRRLAAS